MSLKGMGSANFPRTVFPPPDSLRQPAIPANHCFHPRDRHVRARTRHRQPPDIATSARQRLLALYEPGAVQ